MPAHFSCSTGHWASVQFFPSFFFLCLCLHSFYYYVSKSLDLFFSLSDLLWIPSSKFFISDLTFSSLEFPLVLIYIFHYLCIISIFILNTWTTAPQIPSPLIFLCFFKMDWFFSWSWFTLLKNSSYGL
jgi:hypothetical protein